MRLKLTMYRFFVGGIALFLFGLLLHIPFRLRITTESILGLGILFTCGGLIQIILLRNSKMPTWEFLTSVVLEIVPAILGTLIITIGTSSAPNAIGPLVLFAVAICIWFTAFIESYPQKSEQR